MERFNLLRNLVGVKHVLSLFPGEHPIVERKTRHFLKIIEKIRKEDGEAQINIIGPEVFVNRHPLRQESLQFKTLIREIADTGVNKIVFHEGVRAEEVISLAYYLNECPKKAMASEPFTQALQKRGIEHITVQRVQLLSQKGADSSPQSSVPKTEYYRAVAEVESVFNSVLDRGRLPYDNVRFITHSLLEAAVKDRATLEVLVNIKNYDDYTFRHSVNVACLGLVIGEQLGFDRKMLSLLGEAALLHDVGKIMTPNEIVTKPGALNAKEWEAISQHPVAGAEILSSVPQIDPIISSVALEHHVRYDGGGYPRLREKRGDNYMTQIVSVCDFYDALTTLRSYRKPMLPGQAIVLMLRGSNTQFNPVFIKIFIRAVSSKVGRDLFLQEGLFS